MAKCYNCGSTETIHELDNLCESCEKVLTSVNDGPKKPIWVTEFEAEVLGGFLAELLDETENGELTDYANEVISSVLLQLDEVRITEEE